MTIIKRYSDFFVVAAAVLLLGLFPAGADGATGKATLEDIVVTNTRDSLLVYFTVADCFTEEIVNAIDSGMPTSFLFFIRLHEKRRLWADRLVASVTITHEIKYDNLRKVYTVKHSDGEEHASQLTDFEDAKKLMSEIVGLKLAELSSLGKGKKYRVSMMAQLDKVELPFALHRILFFVKLWDFKTRWYSVEFSY